MEEKPKTTKILIVEDELLVAEDLSSRLKEIGYDVTETVSSGEDAIISCEKKLPDLILMDIMLGDGMDGIETQKIIREKYSTPVIYLTSYSDEKTVSRAKSTEPYGYIIKPFEERELYTTIEMAVHKHKIETALRNSEKELRELNLTKDKLFSIISHDLKNPFVAILGFTEVLSTAYHKYDDAEKQKMIRFIHNAAVNTYNLLENLLEWSRIQIRGIKTEYEDICLDELIIDTIDNYTETAEQKQITIKAVMNKNIQVYSDKEMLKTIIRNLLFNAIKFTDRNGTITIKTKVNQNDFVIDVTDTGTGMSEKKQRCLFHLDKSVTTEGTAGEKGTGLGLILCKEFTDKLCGTIKINSELGKGSEFMVTIPHAQKD
jgi:signal transduction histidine kinase